MSKRINGVIIIAAEEHDTCELCGTVAELRPYGPNGERICYECGMKDEETANLMMRIKLFGIRPNETN